MYLNSVKNRSLNAKTRRSNAVLTRILTIFKSLIKLLKKRKKPEIGLITGFSVAEGKGFEPLVRYEPDN